MSTETPSHHSTLLLRLAQGQAQFGDVLAHIDAHYSFTPTAFHNGSVHNNAGENSGSCRIFAFAQANQLNEQQTLSLFAEHYNAVQLHPEGTDHQNIRNFIQHGWNGIRFADQALTAK